MTVLRTVCIVSLMTREKKEIQLLARLRLEMDLSYRALAKDIGVSQMALFNILKEESTPTERTMFKIHNYLVRGQHL